MPLPFLMYPQPPPPLPPPHLPPVTPPPPIVLQLTFLRGEASRVQERHAREAAKAKETEETRVRSIGQDALAKQAEQQAAANAALKAQLSEHAQRLAKVRSLVSA
jgi:hypothetical protein